MKIRTKLSLFQALVVFVVFSITGLTIISSISHNLGKKAELDQYESILNLKNTVNNYYELSVDNHLKGISLATRGIVKNSYDKYLKKEISETDLYRELSLVFRSIKVGKTGYPYILGYNGDILAHPIITTGTNLLKYEFIKEQLKQKSGYSEYMWKNIGEEKEREKVAFLFDFPELSAIIAISAYKEEFSYLINIGDFRDNILSISYGESGYPYVLDYEGNLIIHPKREGDNIIDSVDSEGNYFIQDIISNKTGSIIYPYENAKGLSEDKLVHYFDMPELGLIFAGEAYMSELYSVVNLVKNYVLISYATAAVLVTFALIFVAGSLFRRIKKIATTIKQISTGDYSTMVDYNGDDEISSLSVDINLLVNNFNKSMSQINRSVFKNNEIQVDLENGILTSVDAVAEVNTRSFEIMDVMKDSECQIQNANETVDKLIVETGQISRLINEQAGSVNESNNTLIQMLSLIKNVSKVTRTKQGISEELMVLVENGKRNIGEITEAVTEINNQVDHIIHIAIVLSDIAERTNLLAKNAVIDSILPNGEETESSIISDEIRKLSENTAIQSSIIGVEIDNIIKLIKTSVISTKEAELTFIAIDKKCKDVADSLVNITGTTEELKFDGEKILLTTNDLKQVYHYVQDRAILMSEEAEIIRNDIINTHECSTVVNRDLEDIVHYIERINLSTGGVKTLSHSLGETSNIINKEIKNFRLIN